MNRKSVCIVYDPIPYQGGSKVATRHAMCITDPDVRFHVLTCSKNSWPQDTAQYQSVSLLPCPARLLMQTRGAGYWVKQAYLTCMLGMFFLYTWLRLHRKPDTLLLASGPGVDLAGYLLASLLNLHLVQLIHGPVGCSRAARWCLQRKHATFYLESAKTSLLRCFNLSGPDTAELPHHCIPFNNGLVKMPKVHRFNQSAAMPRLYWAASLLKWKGLDLLIEALKTEQLCERINTTICYIRPRHTQAALSQPTQPLSNCQWREAPKELDEIRAGSDIYVSTSINEPFGLSTLEALAAGLIVIIPADGAYWDQKLTHNLNCLKYTPQDSHSLNQIIVGVAQDIEKFQAIAVAGQTIARDYDAARVYRPIADAIASATPLRENRAYES